MGGGSSTPANTTQTQEPWAEQKPYLQQGFGYASDLLNGLPGGGRRVFEGAPNYYPGSTYAGIGNLTARASDAMYNNGAGMSPLIAQVQGGAMGNFSEGQQQMINNTIAAARPSIDSAFASNGRLGSGSQAAALADSATRTVQNAQNQYASMLPGLMQTQTGLMQGAGQIADQDRQNYLNADVERWNFDQNRQWNTLANYAQLIQGNYGGTNTSTVPVFSNPGMQYAGAAIGGMGALGQLGQGIGAMGWSDIRLKENIRKVGELDNGLGVYAYNYIDDDRQQIGLLAQEVQQSKPDAVGNFGGLLAVDYGKAVQ